MCCWLCLAVTAWIAGYALAVHNKALEQLRRLQDQGYSWQIYIGEQDDEPAVCVELSRDQKNTEGCANSISGAVRAAKSKL